MLEYHVASDRAVRYAIETGRMPNISLIHEMQRAEGFETCFGRAVTHCERTHCRWHGECMALLAFKPKEEVCNLSDRNKSQARTEHLLATHSDATLRGLPDRGPDHAEWAATPQRESIH